MTRRTRHVLIGAGALVALGALLLGVEKTRGSMKLRAWEKEMAARGQKLSVAELTPSPASGSSARLMLPGEVSSFLTVSVPANSPVAMLAVAPGKARVVSGMQHWLATDQSTNNWRTFAAQFESTLAQLAELRPVLTNRPWIVRLDYEQDFAMLVPHLSVYKAAGQALSAAALLDLHEGRLDGALENLVALLALVDQPHEDRLLICQLVRLAVAYVAVGTTWEALQTEGWTDRQLARLQAAWQGESVVLGMARAIEMERATAAPYFAGDRSQTKTLLELLDSRGPGSRPWATGPSLEYGDGAARDLLKFLDEAGEKLRARLFLALWRFAWAGQDQWRHHQTVQTMLDGVRRAVAQKNWAAAGLGAADRNDEYFRSLHLAGEESRLYDRMRYWMSSVTLPSLRAPLGRAARVEAMRGMTLGAIALKRCHLAHGQWPSRLADLVPEFLPEVPRDFMDGQPLRYRAPADGAFLLYSIGGDGRDDGGAAQGDSTSFRNLFSGRDMVWPQMAGTNDLVTPKTRRR